MSDAYTVNAAIEKDTSESDCLDPTLLPAGDWRRTLIHFWHRAGSPGEGNTESGDVAAESGP